MIRKKYLQEDIDSLESSVSNLYKTIRSLEKNQELEIGEGEKPKLGWWYTDRNRDGLVYTKITTKDVLIALLKYLKLEIVEPEIKPVEKPKKFEIVPISKKQKVKEGGDSKPVNNVDDLLETDGIITVSITGGCLERKSTFIEKILQTEFGGYTVVEANDHFIRYANLRAWMPTGKKPKRGE